MRVVLLVPSWTNFITSVNHENPVRVQLERLRQQDHEVRWIDPEDVKSCFACDSSFVSGTSPAERKANCHHCGKVHCSQCLQNSMPSGPMGRPAPVCNVCYTLLNKHVAPYFSTSFQDPTTGAQIRVSSPNARRDGVSQSNSAPGMPNKNKNKFISHSPHFGRNKTMSDVNNKSS
ncbi:Rab GTPase-binding effector protein 1 [Fasciola gigantica]|uniref:Rab GTPase-binding effector protein 1 n=1 Tax=Fasciola gigantica TaxID=46835 RepID=A0A504YT99_FASGI|nr:Rab GTPase-binding effector protein 1 [Fasciola gigantica]